MSAGQRIKADYPLWLNQGWGALGGDLIGRRNKKEVGKRRSMGRGDLGRRQRNYYPLAKLEGKGRKKKWKGREVGGERL